MRRILVSECKQEISSFNPVPGRYEDFLIDRGNDILAYHRGVRSEVGGALAVFALRPELEIAGGYSARGITSTGTLASADFMRIAREFLDAVRGAGALDGIYFALHGALASEDIDDAEGYLLEETRRVAGEEIPIVVSLDLHGILTDRMLRHSDAAVPYQTNPHVDFYRTGERAARLLLRLLDREIRPLQIRVKIPALVRGYELITETGLFRAPLQHAVAFENSAAGLAGGIFIGNPFTDVPDLASNVLLVANENADRACAEAVSIALKFWAMRERLQQRLIGLEESVRLASSLKGRVVLVDAADATSSGASGDSNAILAELLRAACRRTALVPLVDAPAVELCFAAGVGAEVRLMVGGSLDPRFHPVEVSGTVKLLSDGHLRSESHGEAWYAGRTAVLRCGPITLVLTSRPVSLYDRTLFLANGQDPACFDMTVVKSPLCQPRFFADGAERMIDVDAPGATSANVRGLGHRHAARPLYPLDLDFEYAPRPQVFERPRCR